MSTIGAVASRPSLNTNKISILCRTSRQQAGAWTQHGPKPVAHSAHKALRYLTHDRGGAVVRFACALRVAAKHHGRIVPAPLGDDVDRSAVVEQQRFVAAPQIVKPKAREAECLHLA